ncbi:MAG: TolC family protein [Chlorobi bacterium]|nr:MAG: TolC family protein [Bacteroidota bacterium]MBE2265452.1 TolC family protein [Flavobacteriales bacterium]MBL1160516.1 TolC family protein [Chlorobiota bacterium]MBW7853235.1 TolC family protein [Candidatus Kapabacteria bacterium]MCC6331276.1 TolC family protein [Ignavibacteria bacterium]
MVRKLLTACVLLCTMYVPALRSAVPVTLDEAIQTAIRKNQSIAIARLSISKARAQRTEALSGALPFVGVSATYNYNVEAPVFFVPNFLNPQEGGMQPMRFGLNNSYNVAATFNQVLFNSAVFTGIGAAAKYVGAATDQYRAAVADVVTETRRRFLAALAAREMAQIAQSAYNLASEHQKTVKTLFEQGMVAEYDLIRANVALENIRPELTSARVGYKNAVAALMTYMNADQTDTLEPQSVELPEPGSVPDVNESTESALKHNYQLVAMESQLAVSDKLIDVYRSGYYPTVSLIGQYGNSGQSDDFKDWVSASQAFIGLNLSLNIFNGMRTASQLDQATIDYQTLGEHVDQLKNLLRLQVSASINELTSARERIIAQAGNVQQAERGYEIAKIRYAEGTGSQLEINDSQSALTRAQVNRLGALYDYYIRLADFEKSIGKVPDKYIRYAEEIHGDS